MTEPTPKPQSSSVAAVFAVTAVVVAGALLFGAISSNRGPASPAAKPGSDAARKAALRETMKGSTVKDAYWSQDASFWISMIDDGTRRDGYAQSVCQIVRDAGVRDFVIVTAWDAVAMNRGEFRQLGKGNVSMNPIDEAGRYALGERLVPMLCGHCRLWAVAAVRPSGAKRVRVECTHCGLVGEPRGRGIVAYLKIARAFADAAPEARGLVNRGDVQTR